MHWRPIGTSRAAVAIALREIAMHQRAIAMTLHENSGSDRDFCAPLLLYMEFLCSQPCTSSPRMNDATRPLPGYYRLTNMFILRKRGFTVQRPSMDFFWTVLWDMVHAP
jgi:hypothetical protein